MKLNKKKVTVVAVAMSLIAILSLGTLAWFNASDEVVNEFHVADSDGDGTPDFTIDVYEQEVDEDGNPVYDEYGNPIYTGNEGNQENPGGNTYTDILPGDKLPKNATIQNTGDYDQWVRIHLTFSDSAVWQQAIAKAAAAEDMEFDAYVLNVLLDYLVDWECESYEVNYNVFGEDTMTYTLYYGKVVTPGTRIFVLGNVNIPGVLTQEDMNFGTDGFTLTIKAEAVQVENLKATTASEAFAEVGWEVGAAYGE